MSRKLKFFEALREAQDQCMAADDNVTLMGLGIYFANAWWFDPQAPLIQRIGILFGEITLGVVIYICASWLMKNEELKFIHQLIREKRAPRPA